MKDKSVLKLPDDLFYSDEHIWIRPGKEYCEVGISDFAQDQLGGVVFVELPEKGQSFDAGESFGNVESVKAVNSLFMPVKGTVAEVNAVLEDKPEKLNSDCYGEGWLIRILPDNPEDVEKLKRSAAYRAGL